MGTLINIAQFIMGLSLLIILHELGHFLPAKWFKTRVEKFYLFFDFAPFNSLFKITRGGTEYGIGWLPLGGYVKIAGMVDESMDTESLKNEPQPWEFRSKPAWQRLIIMLGGVTVNFLLGIFIFSMMLWQYGEVRIPTASLQNGLALDSVLINQGFQQGDNIVRLGDKPFTYVDPGAFMQAVILDNTQEITILRNGQQQTIQLPANISQILTQQNPGKSALMLPRYPFFVNGLAAGNPAEKAGIQKGDRIISIDGQPTQFFDEFGPLARKKKGQAVTIGVLRGQDILALPLTLTEDGLIGARPQAEGLFPIERSKYSLLAAFPAGYHMATDFLGNQLRAFGQMFRGKIGVKENLGGLISIGKLYGSEWDWEKFWTMTANLSLILAFMNLLPIPALDGGYVVFLLWEVITRRRVSDKFMERAVTLGFFLLLGLMIFANGLDIWKTFIK